jgi:hypothetical protein
MISSETGLNQKFSSKLFWVLNDFLVYWFEPKNVMKTFLAKKFLGSK